MNKQDKSLDLSIFMKKDRSLDLTKYVDHKQSGGKSNVIHETNEDKLQYKRDWYKKNSTKGKNVKGYNKKYYAEHKEKLKLKRQTGQK